MTDPLKAPTSPELERCLNVLRSVLSRHNHLLNLIIAVLVEHPSAKENRKEKQRPEAVVCSVIAPMIQALGSSSNTLLSLSDGPGLHTRDCYGIVRSMVEIAVNTSYIMAEGVEAANQAYRHARQKSYRDLDRQSTVRESTFRIAYSNIPTTEDIDGLEGDIDYFTSTTGREKGWTTLSVDERIAVCGEKLGRSVLNSLHWCRFCIYRHSSEILHGTLFGTLYFYGATRPSQPKSKEELAENMGEHHMVILLAAVVSISAVVEAFHSRFGYAHAYNSTRAQIQEIKEIPMFQKDLVKNKSGTDHE